MPALFSAHIHQRTWWYISPQGVGYICGRQGSSGVYPRVSHVHGYRSWGCWEHRSKAVIPCFRPVRSSSSRWVGTSWLSVFHYYCRRNVIISLAGASAMRALGCSYVLAYILCSLAYILSFCHIKMTTNVRSTVDDPQKIASSL